MSTDYSVAWWDWRLAAARSAMAAAPRSCRALIEVAAQHPLVEGHTPGPEFAARLDLGARLAGELESAGLHVAIYVPGSQHRSADVEDHVTLSAAGTAYLRERLSTGVDLHGDDLNRRYKGDDGVYGSGDECFVTAAWFRDGGFQTLHAVVSPYQLPRKLLHYIAAGVEPMLHTAPVQGAYHDPIYELATSVPYTLWTDPTAQGADSAKAQALRAERKID